MRIAIIMTAAGLLAAAPAFAQSDSTTNPFAKTPSWSTSGFAKTPPANTKAFAHAPSAGTNAFGGGQVTAFGNGGPTTNATGNTASATNNAHRMANSFGTGSDHNAVPVGQAQPKQR